MNPKGTFKDKKNQVNMILSVKRRNSLGALKTMLPSHDVAKPIQFCAWSEAMTTLNETLGGPGPPKSSRRDDSP